MSRIWQARLWLPALALVFAACASGRISGGTYVNDAKGFAMLLPSSGWTAETAEAPDLLLRHADRQAGISIHATCDGIPPDRPLEIVGRHLFFGIRGKETLLHERRSVLGHEALEIMFRGEQGGRELLVHGHVFRAQGCVYDLVLFAAPEDYAEVNGDFERMARGFREVQGEQR